MPRAQSRQQTTKARQAAAASQVSPVEYVGRRAKTGNSLGFRFEGAFFKSHPEFSGEVRARVIAPGRLLVVASPVEDTEDDPVIASFLAWMKHDMVHHPENLRPLDEGLTHRIASLVEGVTVSADEDFGDQELL